MRVLALIFSFASMGIACFFLPHLWGRWPAGTKGAQAARTAGTEPSSGALRAHPHRLRVRSGTSPTSGGSKAHRVVSTSLCGDSYVLSMLAEPDIAALSWQSGDALSTAPESFKNKPKASDDIEVLLALNPSLVVFGPGEGAAAKPLLDKRGIKYVSLNWGEDFDSVRNNTEKLAIASHKEAIKPNRVQRFPRQQPSVLYLSASGGTAGPDTYVDAAIRMAGGTNIITTQGWHTPSIESLVVLNPDLIVTSFFQDGYASVNEAGLRNKVLRDKIKTIPRVNVPGKYWPCAGPGLYEATNIIATAIAELP